MSNQPNISWPGWEVVRLIGRGSFGAVYEIQRTLFDDVEKAALKVISIPPDESDVEELYGAGYDDETITETFRDHLKSVVAEYSLMRRMNGHSNIVNCDDVSYIPHADGFGWDIYIKMELLTPLLKTLETTAPEEMVRKVACDLCRALMLCKKYDILHRDIKPQNIFLSPNGDYKLGDFGIAKTVEKTMGGTRIGTYRYMAPEVYNNQPYGVTADIYSLGLVLYQLLNERRLPFMPLPPEKPRAGQEEDARKRRLAGESIPTPVHGSEGLKAIVLKACAYDPKRRYASAEEMLRALEALGHEVVVSEQHVEKMVIPPKNTASASTDRMVTIPVVKAETVVPNSSAQVSQKIETMRPVNNTGFSSADEMLEALGMQSPYKKKAASVQSAFKDSSKKNMAQTDNISVKKAAETRELPSSCEGNDSTVQQPQKERGQPAMKSPAEEMLEALGMRSPYKKGDSPAGAIFKDSTEEVHGQTADDERDGWPKHRMFPW